MRKQRQSLIGNYFKTKASSPQITQKPTMSETDKKVKKRKLSLIKPVTPTKSPKVTHDEKNVKQLSDGEEEIAVSSPKIQVIDLTDCDETEAVSDTSVLTELYSLSPSTPKKTALTERTLDYTPRSSRSCLQFEDYDNSNESSTETIQAYIKSEKPDDIIHNTLETSIIPIKKETDEPQEKQKSDTCNTKITIEVGKSPIKVEKVKVSLEIEVSDQNTPSEKREIIINGIPIKSEKTPEKTSVIPGPKSTNTPLPGPSQESVHINGTPIKSENSYETPEKMPITTGSKSKDTPQTGPSQESVHINSIPINLENSYKTPEKMPINPGSKSTNTPLPGPSQESVHLNGKPIKSEDSYKTPEKMPINRGSKSKYTPQPGPSQESAHIYGKPIKSEHSYKTPEKMPIIPGPKSTNTPLPGPSQESVHINGTPIKSENACVTPQKTPESRGNYFQSPSRKDKFFSPTKKRSVVKRTPTQVKRSLSMDMSPSSEIHQLLTNACDGMDDKTIFLLTIINQYLNNNAIKNLLDTNSQELLTICLKVAKPGMRLVCRLYWRKTGWYKMEQVKQISFEKMVGDDATLQDMIKSLVENQLIDQGDMHNMYFDDYKTILSRPELMQICKELKLKMTNKQDAIEALYSFSKRTSNISHFVIGCTSNNSKIVLEKMSRKAGPCYRLSDLARTTLEKLYILMYMGMDYNIIREKKLELILLYDKIGRETYPVDKAMVLDNASVVFRSRDEFERYLTAYEIYEDLQNKTDLTERCEIIKNVYILYNDIGQDEMTYYRTLPLWLHRYTPANVYVKILENSIQDLKKSEHCLLALQVSTTLIGQTIFRQHKKAEWYCAKALILHSLDRYDEAAQVLLEGFKSNLSEEEKDSMRPRARKVATQKNIVITDHLKKELLEYATKDTILEKNLSGEHINKQPMDRTNKRGKVKFETRTEGGRTVHDAEEYCITHYICTGRYTHGEHWEGRIVSTIFNLLFWDIIYSKPNARGIFLSHYQLWPLDMFCGGSFYENRKTAIDAWLNAIENYSEAKLLAVLEETWIRRPESELSGISRGIGCEKVKMVASCLGARAVAAICRRLATNYRYSHSGFPDLTLWNVHTKQIKFVEVKTDTDKPSMKQIQWMHYLRQHGVDTEFCYLGANTTRQRCRNAKPEPVRTDAI